MAVIAVDVGFSDTKVKTKLKQFKFTTAVVESVEGGYDFGEKEEVWEFGGKKYLIGEPATKEFGMVYARNYEFLEMYSPLFVAKAIEEAGFSPDLLVVGLPIKEYSANRERYRQKLLRFEVNGKVYSQEVFVVPQGVGVLHDYIVSHLPPSDESGFVIDIGFNTVIVVHYEKLKARARLSKQYDKLGIGYAVELFGKLLASEKGIEVDGGMPELARIFKEGKLKRYGEVYPVESVKIEALDKYVSTLLSKIENDFDREIASQDRLVFAGGGTNFLKGYLPEKYEKMAFFMEEPEFSNVRGFYAVGKELEREKICIQNG